ncbi:DNA circularization N-terminal domain-containing protein [Sorangium sp. So ce1389]|uniref:DNA circularization N-terminal domain-containing protein n=1 Tax=Sorangium sp. So ce1389 TaxID=3133336 RepID=UPI003F5EACDD
MANDIFAKYPPATWDVAGQSVTFQVETLQETGGNRLVQWERPYRDGAKLDDTGSRAKGWTLSAIFYLGGSEPGIDPDQYPDALNKLLASFDEHETGTLTLPTRGPVRCRAESYNRVETSAERDVARVTLTFLADNEDNTTAASFTAPSARSVVRQQVEAATFWAQQQGAWSGDLSSLTEFAAELEGLINSPFEAMDQIEAKAKAIDSACERVENAFTGASSRVPAPLNRLLGLPPAVATLRGLRALRDTSRRAASDALSSLPRIVTKTFPTPKNLVGLSGELGQPFEQLLKINSGLDPLLIPPGTPVRVFG